MDNKSLTEKKNGASYLLEYFEIEANDLQEKIFITVGWRYRKLLNAEESAYRHSSEYRRAKSKAYWSRPKEVRDREMLENELAKLDYWMPHRGTNDHHISYSKKVDDDASSNWDEPLIGFTPSISEAGYYNKVLTPIERKITDPVLSAVLKNIKSSDSPYITRKKFDISMVESIPKLGEEYLRTFCEQYEVICSLLDITCFTSFNPKLVEVVTNGCTVEAMVLEQNKLTTITVNICKYKGQTNLLGKRVGDMFKLSNIPLTYQVAKILK